MSDRYTERKLLELEEENKSLKEQLKESVDVINDLNTEIKSLEADINNLIESNTAYKNDLLAKETILRDTFAMAALTGLLSDHEVELSIEKYATYAYRYADEMLAERAR